MEYTLNIETPSYLCDDKDRLHAWAGIRLCQEVSEYHGNSLGVGFDALVRNNLAWVIVRSYYEVYARPHCFERLRLDTWARGHDGLFAFRDYSMQGSRGEQLILGTSYWSLIDYTRRRVVRLNEHIKAYEIIDRQATQHSTLGRLACVADANAEPALKQTAQYSSIDHTGHVNNSEYIKWIFDALHATGFDFDGKYSIELNFQHETKCGDEVLVYMAEQDDAYHFTLAAAGQVKVIAKVRLIG